MKVSRIAHTKRVNYSTQKDKPISRCLHVVSIPKVFDWHSQLNLAMEIHNFTNIRLIIQSNLID